MGRLLPEEVRSGSSWEDNLLDFWPVVFRSIVTGEYPVSPGLRPGNFIQKKGAPLAGHPEERII
jgi:hypothetical protein